MESTDDPRSAGDRFVGLMRCGGWAALISVALTALQVGIFVIWPPGHTVAEVFRLMVDSPVLGLVSMDLVYVVNNLAVWLFYVGLAVPLWQVSRSGTVIAMGLGTLQMAAYLASNPALELFALGRAHAGASLEAQQTLVAAGEAALARWNGTAFVAYYLLGAAVLLVLAGMLRHTVVLGRATCWWALAAGLLMLVPSPFGAVGMAFALASLVPWSGFCVLAGGSLLRLAR